MESANDLILLFQVLYGVTALGTMFVVISENRNPVKTISWVLILLLLPLVGLIVYYFFGEDNRKQRLISHKIQKKIKERLPAKKDVLPVDSPVEYIGLTSLLNCEGDTPLYNGSSVEFYSTGKDKFHALFAEIEKAKIFIHVQYYIYMDDDIGQLFSELLIRKVSEGVKVRLLYDDVGSWKAKRKYFDNLTSKGIEVEAFLKVKFRWLTSRVNYRNHRKIVIIDGKIGFVGGMNVADRYIKGMSFGIWRDSHIRVEGLAVAGLQSSFMVDWYSSRGEILSEDLYYPELESRGSNLIQFATSGPVGQFKTIHIGILHAINTATKSVYIQTPYFIPTDALMLSVQMAAIRGVDVRLMVPRHSDTTFVHVASMSFLKEVLDAGVKVYLFDAGFLHSKLTVVDDELTITGSANMDIRSFEHNFEINAFIYNEETASKAKAIFHSDSGMSTKLDAVEWDKRSRFQKFKESIMRLFSPLL